MQIAIRPRLRRHTRHGSSHQSECIGGCWSFSRISNFPEGARGQSHVGGRQEVTA